MSEYEKFTPAESQAHSLTAPQEAPQRNESREAKLNPRIQTLMNERDAAERKLQKAILDVETREQSPAFQEAQRLYSKGSRAEYSDTYTDPDYVVFLYANSPEEPLKECIVLGVSSDEGSKDLSSAHILSTLGESWINENHEQGNILSDLALNEREDKWQIIKYLVDITSEQIKIS